jgi:hypothetical protein
MPSQYDPATSDSCKLTLQLSVRKTKNEKYNLVQVAALQQPILTATNTGVQWTPH